MVKIDLYNFKCYKKSSFILKDNNITLVSGPSGIGKTSLILSIFWCLHGGLRKVYRNGTTGKSCVTITFDEDQVKKYGIKKIYRQGRPNLLSLFDDKDDKYEDKVAQSIIDKNFGTKEVWMATSYIAQKNLSILMSGSNKARMNILNQISFLSDNPEELIDKIDTNIKSYTSNFTTKQEKYKAEKKVYDVEVSKISFDYKLTLEEIQNIKQSLTKLGIDHKDLIYKLQQQNIVKGKISMIKSQLDVYKTNLLSLNSNLDIIIIPDKPTTSIDQLNLELNNYEKIYKEKEKEISKSIENNKILHENITKYISKYNKVKIVYDNTNDNKELRSLVDRKQYIKETIKLLQNNLDNSKLKTYTKTQVIGMSDNIKIYADKYKSCHSKRKQLIESVKLLKLKYQKAEILNKKNNKILSQYQYRRDKYKSDINVNQININKTQNDINEYNNITSIDLFTNKKDITPEYIWKLKQNKDNYDKMKQEYITLKLDYNKISKITNINSINKNIDTNNLNIEKYKLFLQIYNLETQYNKIKHNNTTLEDILNKKEHLNHLQSKDEVLECPKCHTTLVYISKNDTSTLRNSSETSISKLDINILVKESKQLILSMKQDYEVSKKQKLLKETIDSMIDSDYISFIDSINIKYNNMNTSSSNLIKSDYIIDTISKNILIHTSNNEDLSGRLKLINKLKYIEENKISVDRAEKIYAYNNLCDILNKLLKEKDILNLDILSINNNILELENSKSEDIDKIKNIIKEEEIKIEEYTENATKYHEDYNKQLRKKDIYINIYNNHQKIEKDKKENIDTLIKLESDIDICKQTHTNNIKLAKENLDNTISEINIYINKHSNNDVDNITLSYLDTKKNSIDELIKLYNIKMEKLKLDYNENKYKYIKEKQNIINKENIIKQKIDQKDNIKHRIEEINEKLSKLQLEYSNYKDQIIVDIEVKIKKIEVDVIDTKQMIESANIYLVYKERKDNLNKMYDSLLESRKYLVGLHKYRKICINIECDKLQKTVNSINAIMNDILSVLFDDAMTVNIKLYKKIKSNGRVKPSVNLKILYNGYERDTLLELSGGECDRVSLSLAVAMARNSRSPFLLLDETMASVGESLRTKSINMIRNVLYMNKTVICIGHVDTEGNYDNVIRLPIK